MPSKSKRNRRAASRRAPSQNRSEVASPATTSPEATSPTIGGQYQKPVTYSPAPRAATNAPILYSSFVKDLKWTGIVTGIIIVLLIVSYAILR